MIDTSTSRRALLRGAAATLVIGRAGAQASAPVRVGSTLPLTGPLAQTGQVHKVAGEVFVDGINQRRGLLGRRVEWVLLDDQSQAGVTRNLYERLLTVDKVDLIMGPYGTSSILAAMSIAQRYGKLFIQSSLGNMSLATYDRQFPSLPSGPHGEITGNEILFGALAAGPKPPKTVTIVSSKFPSALFLADAAHAVAERRGLTIASVINYEFGTRDLGAIASRVKEADADLMWMGALGLEGNQLLEAMGKVGYKPRQHFYIYPAAGAMAAAPIADGALAFTWFEEHPPMTEAAGAPEFIKAYDERAAKAGFAWPHVDHQAGGEYAAWQMMEAAAIATNRLDDKAMAAWLRANHVGTVLGHLRFDGQWNTGNDETKIKQLQGGAWKVIWPTASRAPGVSLRA